MLGKRGVTWNAPVLDNFKPPHLSTFDGRGDPMEHVTTFNTRMVVVGAANSLKCKLLARTFTDVALRWYINLPRFSIVSYQDMVRNLSQQFSVSRHRKVSSNNLFNVRQGQNESLRNYLARFNDSTIKVSNPNQELFVGAFQNGLRAGQFNESLAQKPTDSMEEIISRAECCIKGEENNAEKRARDVKEKGSSGSECKNYDIPPSRDRGTFKRQPERDRHPRRYASEHFTPLMMRPERILKEVYESKIIPEANPPRTHIMGSNKDAWCKYHRVRGHYTDNCIHLKRDIEKLIQSGKLRGYTKGRHDENGRGTNEVRDNRRGEENKQTLNTILGGFAGGVESSASRKNYARQIMFIDEGSHGFAEKSSDITFSAKDFKSVVPHDNDPMVITLQILNWNIKRVLIDTSSSADILTYKAFDKMGLSEEQLQPFQGTLSGFTEERVCNALFLNKR